MIVDDPLGIERTAVYDILREAANRLGGMRLHLAITPAERRAIAAMRAVDDEINAIDLDDLAAQKALTEELARAATTNSFPKMSGDG